MWLRGPYQLRLASPEETYKVHVPRDDGLDREEKYVAINGEPRGTIVAHAGVDESGEIATAKSGDDASTCGCVEFSLPSEAGVVEGYLGYRRPIVSTRDGGAWRKALSTARGCKPR